MIDMVNYGADAIF